MILMGTKSSGDIPIGANILYVGGMIVVGKKNRDDQLGANKAGSALEFTTSQSRD